MVYDFKVKLLESSDGVRGDLMKELFEILREAESAGLLSFGKVVDDGLWKMQMFADLTSWTHCVFGLFCIITHILDQKTSVLYPHYQHASLSNDMPVIIFMLLLGLPGMGKTKTVMFFESIYNRALSLIPGSENTFVKSGSTEAAIKECIATSSSGAATFFDSEMGDFLRGLREGTKSAYTINLCNIIDHWSTGGIEIRTRSRGKQSKSNARFNIFGATHVTELAKFIFFLQTKCGIEGALDRFNILVPPTAWLKPEDTPFWNQNENVFKEEKELFIGRLVETVRYLIVFHKDAANKYSFEQDGIDLCQEDLRSSRSDSTSCATNGQEVFDGKRKVEHTLRFSPVVHILKFLICRLFEDPELSLTISMKADTYVISKHLFIVMDKQKNHIKNFVLDKSGYSKIEAEICESDNRKIGRVCLLFDGPVVNARSVERSDYQYKHDGETNNQYQELIEKVLYELFPLVHMFVVLNHAYYAKLHPSSLVSTQLAIYGISVDQYERCYNLPHHKYVPKCAVDYVAKQWPQGFQKRNFYSDESLAAYSKRNKLTDQSKEDD